MHIQGCHNLEKWLFLDVSGKLRETQGNLKKIGRSQGNSGNNYPVRKINLILHILTCIHVLSGLNIVKTSEGQT